MRLKLQTPTEVLCHEPITQLTVMGQGGQFTLLPRHVDYAAVIVPSILSYKPTHPKSETEKEIYVAVDGGALRKCQDEVLVSVRQAVRDVDLDHLQTKIETAFKRLDEDEKHARESLVRLEMGLARLMEEIKHA